MNRLRGLYIHVPFCSVKCFYCDFTAFSGQGAAARRYLTALEKEARLRPRLPVDTLYVGGGTPSELSVQELEELVRLIRSGYRPVKEFAESTLEANPESLSVEKMWVLARAGVSRLSLGLQTMEPRLLKEIGRRHSVEDFLFVYKAARAFDFSLNVDLMAGLPGQTPDETASSLQKTLELAPDHISFYALSVEDRTLFAKRGVAGDEDSDRETLDRSWETLEEAGYRHYEISNFAKPGHESVHNRIYWAGGEYIGLGCGASGHLDGIRYSNKDRLQDYCEALERGQSPETQRERLGGKEKLGETLLLGLRRLEGLDLLPEMEALFARELERVERRGWLEREGRRVRLTREGVFLANRVFEEFVAPFGEAQAASSC